MKKSELKEAIREIVIKSHSVYNHPRAELEKSSAYRPLIEAVEKLAKTI